MEYKIRDGDTVDCRVLRNLGDSEYVVRMGDQDQNLRVLSMDARGIEFMLDRQYHRVKYVDSTTAEMNMVVDGVPMMVNIHPSMDRVVYKNSGGGAAGAQTVLRSQIPGKVISVDIEEGSAVKKGDTVCTLESMKMQVGVKAHKDGSVKSIKIKQGGNVAKNDIIVEIE